MGIRSQGPSKAQKKAKQEMMDEQHENQLESATMQTALDQADRIQENLLRFLSDSDLSEGSKSLLRNFTSKSFILGYLNEDEVTEIKWDLRIYHLHYLDLHPGIDSIAQGRERAIINDDADDRLEALSPKQKMQVDTFFEGIWMNVTRARDMKQQEILQTTIARSENVSDDDESDGGLLPSLPGT